MVDWERVRDRIFTIFFRFALGWVGILLSMLLVGGIFSVLKIDMVKYGQYWIGFTILLIVVLMTLRLIFFRDIPKGWTYSEYKEWKKAEGKTEGGFWQDGFNRKFWLGIFGICGMLVTLGILLNNSFFGLLVPQALGLGFLAFVAVLIYKENKGKSRAQAENESAVFQASHEAKYGKIHFWKGFRNVCFGFSIAGLFLLLAIIRNLQLIIFVGGVGSLVVALLLWRSTSSKELSNNEKVKKGLLKKFGLKIKKIRIRGGLQKNGGGGMKYHNPKGVGSGYFESNINHWQKDKWGKDALG